MSLRLCTLAADSPKPKLGPSRRGKEHCLRDFNDKGRTHGKVDESGSKQAQKELYSSFWAPQLDWDHFWTTMVLTHF